MSSPAAAAVVAAGGQVVLHDNADRDRTPPRAKRPSSALTSPTTSLEFAAYLASFVDALRDAGAARLPLRSDGVQFSVADHSWLTLVALAGRARHLADLPVSVVLDYYGLVGPQLEECAAMEIHQTNADEELLGGLLKGLNAGLAAMIIMSSEGVSRRLIVDEILDKLIFLIKSHLHRSILPIFDQSARKHSFHDSYWKSSESRLSSLFAILKECIRRLHVFFARELIPESNIISTIEICSLALRLPDFQLVAIPLLISCFLHHPPLRDFIIDEIVSILSSDRFKSSFLFFSKIPIHLPIAVFLLLVQTDVSGHHSRTIISAIMGKVVRPGQSVGEARGLLLLVVDDLFQCLFRPAFPAAETLLATLFHYLRNLFAKQNVSHSRTIAIEFLGTMVTRLQSHVVGAARDAELLRPPTADFDPAATIYSGADEKMGCECGLGPSTQDFMLDCDECHYWFHGKCVRIVANDVPSVWICNSCALRRHIQQQRSVIDHLQTQSSNRTPTAAAAASHDDLLFQTLLNYFAVRQADPQLQLAKQYVLAQLGQRLSATDPDKMAALSEFFGDPNLVTTTSDHFEGGGGGVNAQQAFRIVRLLSRKHSLLKDNEAWIKVLVNMLGDRQPALRSRVMKALSSLVDSNVALLQQDYIVRAISVAVQDKSVSVREAAVELLGKKLLSSAALCDKYYPLIAGRIRDKGLSVRKRCVKILRDLCLTFPEHPAYVTICAQLVARLHDEPSIRAVVRRAFHHIFFLAFLPHSARRSDSAFLPEFEAISAKIIGVVAALPSVDWLADIIAFEEEGVEAVFADLCSCIVRDLLALPSPEQGLHHIRALHVFCAARPAFLLVHIPHLEPLLKLDRAVQGGEQTLVALLCSIIILVLPLMEKARARLLDNLAVDLKQLILQQSRAVLVNAIPCLCALAVQMKNPGLPQQLLRSFYHYLVQCGANGGEGGDVRVLRSIMRSLLSLGLLIRHFAFDEDAADQLSYESVVELFRSYCRHSDPVVRTTAIQGLVFCFHRKPALLLGAADLIVGALAAPDPAMNAQVFFSLAEFLQNESDHLKFLQEGRGSPGDRHAAGSRFILIGRERHGEMDAGVVVSLMQRLLPSFLTHANSINPEVRRGLLVLLQLLLNERFVNPTRCLPTLVALCSDPVETLANLATAAVADVAVAFPDLLRNCFLDGIRRISAFQIALLGNSRDLFRNGYPDGISRLLQTMAKMTKNVPALLNAILGLAEIDSEEALDVEFVVRILAGIPFQNDEPLHLIYHLTRFIGIGGAAVDEQLHMALEQFSDRNPSGSDLRRLFAKANDISVLIRFKRYLLATFSIAESAVELWNPHTKSGAVCCRKENAAPFALDSLDRLDHEIDWESPIAIEQLRLRYKQFKKMVNGDVSDLRLDYSVKSRVKRSGLTPSKMPARRAAKRRLA